ncbi:MAG: ATP-dependent zinc metalloprotease FtsH [Actinomycetota bacterium]
MRTRVKEALDPHRLPDPLKRAIGSVLALGRPILGLVAMVIALFVLYFVLLDRIQPAAPGRPLTYDQLERTMRPGAVVAATFYDEDARVGLVTQDGNTFWTAYPRSDAETANLIDRMISTGARVEIDHQSGKGRTRFIAQFLLPLVILASMFGLFFMVMNRGGQGAEFLGFSRFSGRKEDRPGGITFDDVAGNPEAKTELGEVVDYLKDPGRFEEVGALAPKGVLLAGPPGTGKTLLARAVAGEAAVPFFSLSGSEFVESLVGVGAARVRDLFRQAREAAPAIIFIDELDAAGRARGAGVGQGNDEREQTLNQMLVEMDGFSVSSGIVILAATNRPDILDPALLRPGRFDRRVVVDVPDVDGRAEILSLYATKRPLGVVDLRRIAHQTPGFTGADLANLVNEAALLAVRERRSTIEQRDLEEAIDRVLAGPQRRSHILTEVERHLVALHEAGHAVAAAGVGVLPAVNKISIVARGRSLGHTTAYRLADRMILKRTEMERQLVAHLGGTAIELLRLGELSTGSQQDLQTATDLAREMVTIYGMSDRVGRVSVGRKGGEVFLGKELAQMGNLSASLMEIVDEEIRALIEGAERRAMAILARNSKVVDAIVGSLLERETLTGPELDALIDSVRAEPESKVRGDSSRSRNGKPRPAVV